MSAYDAISEYTLYGQELQSDNWAVQLVCAVKLQIDANNKRRSNGKKSRVDERIPVDEALGQTAV